jgi:hypothetical protein
MGKGDKGSTSKSNDSAKRKKGKRDPEGMEDDSYSSSDESLTKADIQDIVESTHPKVYACHHS